MVRLPQICDYKSFFIEVQIIVIVNDVALGELDSNRPKHNYSLFSTPTD